MSNIVDILALPIGTRIGNLPNHAHVASNADVAEVQLGLLLTSHTSRLPRLCRGLDLGLGYFHGSLLGLLGLTLETDPRAALEDNSTDHAFVEGCCKGRGEIAAPDALADEFGVRS